MRHTPCLYKELYGLSIRVSRTLRGWYDWRSKQAHIWNLASIWIEIKLALDPYWTPRLLLFIHRGRWMETLLLHPLNFLQFFLMCLYKINTNWYDFFDIISCIDTQYLITSRQYCLLRSSYSKCPIWKQKADSWNTYQNLVWKFHKNA
jgi:hypothetical protein